MSETVTEPVTTTKLRELQAVVASIEAELAEMEERLFSAREAVLDEEFKDWGLYSVGDIVLAPRLLCGKKKMWPARIEKVFRKIHSGTYSERGRPEIAGKDYKSLSASYRFFWKQKDGTFSGTSDSAYHENVEPYVEEEED